MYNLVNSSPILILKYSLNFFVRSISSSLGHLFFNLLKKNVFQFNKWFFIVIDAIGLFISTSFF